MIKRSKKSYKKPEPKEKATVFPFNDNKQFDIETRKYQNLGHLSPWKRISGNQMLNEDTGEIIDIKKKEKRKEKAVFRILKVQYRVTKNNFKGNETEIIIVLYFNKPITDIEELKRLIKNFIEKLQRKLGEIIFIRVLLYKEPDQPIIHIWVKKADNTKLEIHQDTLEKFWGSNGEVKTIRITKSNIDRLAEYCFDRNIKKNLYPTGIKVYSTSTNIKKVEPIEVDYDQVEELVKGCNQIYGGAVSFTEEIDEKEEEIQHITYESYNKPQGVKLKKGLTTKYKGNFIKKYKQQKENQANKNFAEIEKIIKQNKCWFEVERLDTDLCKIKVKKTGNEFNTLNTRQTLILVKHLLNKK